MIYRLYLREKPYGEPERMLLESREHLAILRRIQEEFRNGTPPEMLWEEKAEEKRDREPIEWDHCY